MQLKDIDLNLLVVFDAIYRERHLTRTGRLLHRTPSAISRSLNRLRVLFNDPLFVREGNRMQPSSLADALWLKVEKGLTML
jgi:DNA-binding transcriptional LysR family regulator